jgi:methionyl-tRNA formyltransferase
VIPPAPWRVAIVTRIPPVVLGYLPAVEEAGHEPVAVLSLRDRQRQYGPMGGIDQHLDLVPPELEVLLPARRSSIAPMLAAVRPDIVLCTGFPWKIPADALAVPPLGWLNGHPSLLPRHRGPVPVAWAIVDGDEETGVTVHRMEPELDTGAVLVQKRFPLGEYVDPEEYYGRMGPLMVEAMREALDLVAAGEPGTVQEGGDYQSFYGGEDVLWLDLEGPALDAHRRVWAWRYTAVTVGSPLGALTRLDGETMRVLESSLTEVADAPRVECADVPLWLVKTEPYEG